MTIRARSAGHTTLLRYGENPQQTAELRTSQPARDSLGIGNFQQLAGAPPSYVNVTDLDRALETLVRAYAALATNQPRTPYAIGVAVKHGNACGAAYSTSPKEALEKMIEGDEQAIFGGVVITNVPIDEHVADLLLRHTSGGLKGRRLLDLVAAPSVTSQALDMLGRKEGKCKIFANPALGKLKPTSVSTQERVRQVRGGELRQSAPTFVLNFAKQRPKRTGKARPEKRLDLAFATAICATSNSNTITIVKDGMLLGQGIGQTSRVGAAALAVANAMRHEEKLRGAVAASDSFFPFPDGVLVLIDAGVTAIFATSGSVNDAVVQSICREAGVTLYQLPDKDARMFFGH